MNASTKNLFLQERLNILIDTKQIHHAVLEFFNFRLAPKILSLIINIKFRFTCGEWKLY